MNSDGIKIDSRAVVEEGAVIGKGTSIWHFAHVRSGSKIGKNCIIGKDVYVDNGVIIGELVDMMSLPANDAYVIERGKKEVLIPVIPEIVRSVDVKMGLVTITPMDGLLD